MGLAKQFGDDLPFVHDGDGTPVGRVVAFVGVNAQEVTEGRKQIGHGDRAMDDIGAVFVGRSDDLTAPNAAAR